LEQQGKNSTGGGKLSPHQLQQGLSTCMHWWDRIKRSTVGYS